MSIVCTCRIYIGSHLEHFHWLTAAVCICSSVPCQWPGHVSCTCTGHWRSPCTVYGTDCHDRRRTAVCQSMDDSRGDPPPAEICDIIIHRNHHHHSSNHKKTHQQHLLLSLIFYLNINLKREALHSPYPIAFLLHSGIAPLISGFLNDHVRRLQSLGAM